MEIDLEDEMICVGKEQSSTIRAGYITEDFKCR